MCHHQEPPSERMLPPRHSQLLVPGGTAPCLHKVLCSQVVWTPAYIICVGEPFPHLNWLTQRAQHDHRMCLVRMRP
ncbi:uncharacterized protein LOC118388879 isoform X3 [Oncorhynchus keta]|uniref:uncharacterized protein LOC118388879 isoform X3 n=1 Tax=Oncorhynchus keta TaxID=8018 RepID=UPI0015FD2694|nr:uncharacterized protein LOC118388879 isoform X3 [Oncorhynchus keta]